MEQTAIPAPAQTAERKKPRPPKGRGKKVLRTALILLLLAAAVLGVRWYLKSRAAAAAGAAAVTYTTAAAEKGDLTSTMSGSGTLEPADAYTVTTLVEGEVLTAGFEEGDIVPADTVLFTIDSSDASTGLERAQLSLEQAQKSYDRAVENLSKGTISAKKGGTVVSLEVEAGDELTVGQLVAVLRDDGVLTLKLPFAADDAAGFFAGQSAAVTLDGSFETLAAAVRSVAAVSEVNAAGQTTRTVTLELANPGALSLSRLATAAVGGVQSLGSGSFEYRSEERLTAEASGTVEALSVREGDVLSAGQTVLTLDSDSLQDAVDSAWQNLRSAQLSLDNQTDTLDNYTVLSPIEGTVIDKYYKAGDKVSAGRNLCLIYDLSYLTLSLSVDELDVSQVTAGQSVLLTADAVPDRTYEGVVTKVSVAGATSGGVTTYPVTVRVDETEGLLPGMNVDARIVLDRAEDVVTIPNEAVERDGTVLVTADSPSAAGAADKEAPAGYVYVSVTTGLSDDDRVAVLSGLQEGDTVAYAVVAPVSSSIFDMLGGGSMPAGGMPSGGSMPAGSMPSGGFGGGGSMPAGGSMPGGN